MRPSLHPRLINDPCDDPGLYIQFLFEKRAIIFDLGELISQSSKDILKISHAFVSHTHMDHFIGFDKLLRLFLGRNKELHLYGPEGFIANVKGKLAGYSWNLVANFENEFVLKVTEVQPARHLTDIFSCQSGFRPKHKMTETPSESVLLKEPSITVSTVILDHSLPCLGFSIKERFHINIKKEAVKALGLEIGPWLREFKQALFNETDPDSLFEVCLKTSPDQKKKYRLGELKDKIALITPGQKITYIVDVVYSRSNAEKMIAFAKGSDHLFIETAFLEMDRDIAAEKLHLTAWQAGRLAAEARVKLFTPFHFSPRYTGQEHLLIREAHAAFEKFK